MTYRCLVVFKKGDATSLDNYRAIAIGAVFGKLYSVLLDTRMSNVAEKEGWRAEGQAGFRPEKSTVDHVFVLRHLIEASQGHRTSKPLFCCFVDFRKAYDMVRRDLLVKCLAELGVHGCMLQAIVQMYWDAPLVPRIGTMLGPEIGSQCGVKQGDPLSPLLFGLFIDELEQWLRERLPGAGVQLGPKLLQMLLYADDLVLFAPNPQMLQQQLDHLHQFCLAKGMEVNVAKTEVVVFRHPQFPAAGEAWQWQIDGQPVARAREFRYLGVILHETEGVSAAISSLATATTRATWAMISRFRVRKVRDIAVKLQMFRALVLPILEYCGAIWGPDMLASSKHLSQVLDNPLQAVQTTFLRGLGQLRKSVSKTVLHKEMCMEPVAKGWLRSSIALWERLQAAPSNSILGITVRESMKRAQAAPKRNTSWAGRFMSMMHMITGQGSRDDAATVQDFVKQFGFDSTADRILPVPSGVVWAAWEKFVQVEPCVIAPLLFNIYMDFVVRQAMAQMPEGCGVKLAYHADGKLERDGCGSGGCVELLSVLLYADDMVLLSPSREELVVMLQVMDKVAASLGLRINASKTEILSIDKDWKEGDVPVQQGPEVVISEGVVKEVSQFKYLGSVLVTDGRLDVELNIRRGKAVGRFKQFEKMWGTKHLSLATKVKCYKAYVLPILLFGSECWSLTKVQSQKLERVHSSCLRSILGVRLSDRHTNEHIRKSCGVATLSAYITANRLRWLGHVGRMEEGRLPHIALFSSLHGDMTRPVGRPRHTWEKCVCADLKVLGQDEGSWEASCQIKSAWRKRLWDLTHPWESQRLVRCRRRTKQAIDKHVERYVVPFSGWEDGGSPVPRWWEPPPAPTRVVLDPAASPPPMCDGSGAGFGF